MDIYYDKDCQLSLLKNKTIVIVGYGSQGSAHANNLKDSGMKVIVCLDPKGKSWNKATRDGFEVKTVAEGVKQADIIMMLAPDEHQRTIFANEILPNAPKTVCMAFAHGFNIHFNLIETPASWDVIMIAPKGPGHLVRSTFVQGSGVPCLVAVHNNASGKAQEIGFAYAGAIGGGRSGIIVTNFRDETETDLFGEQVVLCGGLVSLIKQGFDVLVEAGYPPEMAYFECMHEIKLIVDLMYQGGVADMYYSISNTAEYGAISRGDRLITSETKAEMKKILEEIQSGRFAKEFINETTNGAITLKMGRMRTSQHLLEQTGEKLRAMMPWIAKNRLVEK